MINCVIISYMGVKMKIWISLLCLKYLLCIEWFFGIIFLWFFITINILISNFTKHKSLKGIDKKSLIKYFSLSLLHNNLVGLENFEIPVDYFVSLNSKLIENTSASLVEKKKLSTTSRQIYSTCRPHNCQNGTLNTTKC